LPDIYAMDKQKPKVDIINMVLEDCIIAFPVSSFIISLYKQYQQRGWLTKKQLEGLHDKASSSENILPERLAALEAIIKKMPNRQKSELPQSKPVPEKDESVGVMITAILAKYPQHKRVLFLKSKYDNNETLSAGEVSELSKFKTILKIE
jgi:hypothetical protein